MANTSNNHFGASTGAHTVEVSADWRSKMTTRNIDSIYCANCRCGQHFEAPMSRMDMPDARHRHIVVDWGRESGTDPEANRTASKLDAEDAA